MPKMTLPPILPVDRSIEPSLRALIDGKAKPPGSLGRLEDLAVRLGLICGTLTPRIERATVLVFAGDHGLTEDGVSRYPASVTAAMVGTFLGGRASVNALAAATNVSLRVIDAGVFSDLPPHADLTVAKIRYGSRNAVREPALTMDEVQQAIRGGVRFANDAILNGADTLAVGEMGIGNTASAALLVHRLAPAPLDDCIGPGAGQDEAGMAHKRAVLARAASRSGATAAMDVLAEFGGCEIVMMTGAILGAAAARRPVLIDGFISSAAALAAIRLQPAVQNYCIFAHRSAERGHDAILRALDVEPLLDLDMRLGEGTGAVLAVPLLRGAARLLTDVANLSEVVATTAKP